MFLLIVNPAAGKGKAVRMLPEILKLFQEESKENFELALTDRPGKAGVFTKRALRHGFDKIIAVGGDGTVNEIAQVLCKTDIPLGIIPVGSGNDIAKNLGIPRSLKKIKEVVQIACSDNIFEIDVGSVRTKSFKRYFVNAFGIGFDGQVAARAATLNRRFKKLKSDFAYLIATLQEMFIFKEEVMGLEIPEMPGHKYKHPSLATIIANGKSEGRFFKIAPDALLDDGFFNVSVIEAMSAWQRFWCVLKALKGRHLNSPKVHYQKTAELKVFVKPGQICHLDGEVIQLTDREIEVQILPKALKAIGAFLPVREKVKEPLGFTNSLGLELSGSFVAERGFQLSISPDIIPAY